MHIICNQCKIKSFIEKIEDDYVVLACPVCSKKQESQDKVQENLAQIYAQLLSKKDEEFKCLKINGNEYKREHSKTCSIHKQKKLKFMCI